MYTKDDIRGLCVMAPTPSVEGGEHWSVENSVDLEESARMTDILIRDGSGSIALCGTTGENPALLWEEKLAFVDACLAANRGRVPIFAGATGLGTKETIRQMRIFRDHGVEGVFVGLPLWQTPTPQNSVQWFADLSEAVPDMAVMVYSNSMFFKSSFPLEFWQGVVKNAPTVITNKIASPAITQNLTAIVKAAGHQIAFLPHERDIAGAIREYEEAGSKLRGFWSSNTASMGPEPLVAWWEAYQSGDQRRIDEIAKDIQSVPPPLPMDKFPEDFPKYNAQINKLCAQEAGYINVRGVRSPYRDLPEAYRKTCIAHAEGWVAMRKKYAK
jgi:trans-o-hydroxybenzylidenepyruvate hydratase-aldolase